MTWLRFGVLILAVHAGLLAQDKGPGFSKERPEKSDPAYQEPPEEDAGSTPKEYTFNPLQASKELKIGNYYFKKGSYKAAAHRFQEALKWNPTMAEAALRLGEAEEKLKDKKAAAEAYKKYLELEPEGKEAAAIKKKIGLK